MNQGLYSENYQVLKHVGQAVSFVKAVDKITRLALLFVLVTERQTKAVTVYTR